MRLCVHLSPSISKYYYTEFENVVKLRKTRKGRESLRKALENEQLSEDSLRSGQQFASLLTLPARITTVLQSKTRPTISIAFPLISFCYKWLLSLKGAKAKLHVLDGTGNKEFVTYSELELCVRKTIDLLIIEFKQRFPELKHKRTNSI